jgi:hypothetical protein
MFSYVHFDTTPFAAITERPNTQINWNRSPLRTVAGNCGAGPSDQPLQLSR